MLLDHGYIFRYTGVLSCHYYFDKFLLHSSNMGIAVKSILKITKNTQGEEFWEGLRHNNVLIVFYTNVKLSIKKTKYDSSYIYLFF